MRVLKSFLLALFVLLVVAGCNLGMGDKTALIDLAAISKAMGQDEIIDKKMEEMRLGLNEQLAAAAQNLEKQLVDKKSEKGTKLSEEDKQQLAQYAMNANQQIQQNKAIAQQKAQEFKMALIVAWRNEIQPTVEKIARNNNAAIVIMSSPAVVWFDESIDITAGVISELKAKPVKAKPVKTSDSSAEVVEVVEEVTAK